MAKPKAPEDVVNEMFAIPDPKMFSDKGVRIATARIGQKLSDEAVQNIRAAHPKGMKGTPTTDAQRQKMSRSKLGVKRKPRSKEHAKNLSKALSGRVFSEEHITNLAAGVKAWRDSEPRMVCSVCGVTLGKSGILRYHNDKCRHKDKEKK